jgi:hypothetical protein
LAGTCTSPFPNKVARMMVAIHRSFCPKEFSTGRFWPGAPTENPTIISTPSLFFLGRRF